MGPWTKEIGLVSWWLTKFGHRAKDLTVTLSRLTCRIRVSAPSLPPPCHLASPGSPHSKWATLCRWRCETSARATPARGRGGRNWASDSVRDSGARDSRSSLTSLESASYLYCGPETHEYVTFGGGSEGQAVQRHACGYCGHKTTKYCKSCYEKGRGKIGVCGRT